ncbi:MAG: hypothetical protein DID92_2727744548 [Candidatus Nitrotoga sp. SPKER]|nr:MAG: hypothetical protein DID92_2727744548 [Candidatus Nitrotoga sp. SPKER]
MGRKTSNLHSICKQHFMQGVITWSSNLDEQSSESNSDIHFTRQLDFLP